MINELDVADKDPYSYRRRRPVIPLENFDHPYLHVRANFVSAEVWSLTEPRMAGFSVKMSPAQIRDVLRSGQFTADEKAYMCEVFEQMGPFDIRQFRHNCGASIYELARAMIECKVTHPMVAEWMNCKSPSHRPPAYEKRIYRLGTGITAGWF